MSTFTIRLMTLADVEQIALKWAAAEGWNPGLHDAACFYQGDPKGFLVGLLDNQPVGCISAVKYGTDFAFIGLYIVRPEHRGKGYGLSLWNAAVTSLEGRNIGLDGVVAQQDNYRKSGFKLAYKTIRFEGRRSDWPVPESNINLVPIAQLPFDSLLAYDRLLFPAERPAFLRAWLNQPDACAFAAVDGTQICGYGLIRPCREGFKIGPLFADTSLIANQLLTHLCLQIPVNTPFFMDVPSVNADAVALSAHYQMHPCFETARMYTQSAPTIPLNKVYGVTSLELG